MVSKFLRSLIFTIVLAALIAGGYHAKKKFLDPASLVPPATQTAAVATPAATATDTRPTNSDPTDTPPPKSGPVASPDFAPTDANMQARRDVLKRIDLMPHLTDQQRAKLTDAVGRARNMGCIFIIPFQNGQRTLDARGIDVLVSGFKSAAVQELLKDPTVVFVVLGYADKQGDAASNEKVSNDRTQSVLNAMKDRCGVQNVTYGVGMGGSDLFDGKSASKNRLVEIWATFP